MQPINYMIPQSDPFQQASSILGAFGKIKQLNMMDQQQEQAELANRQAIAQELEYEQAVNETMANPSPTSIAALSLKYPDKHKAFKVAFEQLNEDQKQSEIKQAGAIYSALISGNEEVAKKIVNDNLEAAKNANEDTNDLEIIQTYIERNPKAAATYVGSILSPLMGAENFKAVFEDFAKSEFVQKKQEIELKQDMVDLGYKEEQIKKIQKETENLGYDAKKAVIDLENMQSGVLSPEKKFSSEEKLRKEYATRTNNFSEAAKNYNNIEISADDNSGAGDVALITSFMKMLDPGSVVRETEFATAQDTSGLYERLSNSLQKAETGKFLSAGQRNTFKNLAKKYLNAASKQEEKVKSDMMVIVDNYRLNQDNVFGLGDVEETETPTVEATKPPLSEFGF